MPKRTDINKIMIIGSGPIVVGQACEFDYSGTQGCGVLKREGYEVVLVNSNPATIMTDFGIADKTYIEPIVSDILIKIIEEERPDAILPTLGGQTGLNSTLNLYKMGILEEFGIEIIGIDIESIEIAESRSRFKRAMLDIQLRVANSEVVNSINEAMLVAKRIGFPMIVRASYAIGGSGSGIANNTKKLEELVIIGLKISPISQVILEEFLFSWKEYELELLRDYVGNVVVICSIENIDPVGIHTGDSIAVAPVQTLTDKEYQIMRNAAIDIMIKVGVKGGGANVQFAINSETGEIVVIEMNPRVSRSSALASKATGYPIAKIATQLAVGYNLDEIKNEITGKTVACFEPAIDYCVVKIPRWNLEKFSKTNDLLMPMMKSVGETMAIGRTFKEAIQKAIRSLGIGAHGFGITLLESISLYKMAESLNDLKYRLNNASSKRLLDLYSSFHFGIDIEVISEFTGIDKWFLFQLYQLFRAEIDFVGDYSKYFFVNKNKFNKEYVKKISYMKKNGFSDIQLANLINSDESEIKRIRSFLKVKSVYKSVDSCSAEFYASLPYYYSSYESECDIIKEKKNNKILILGSGPNCIGQGIEFDYCCVHAALSLKEQEIESIIINSNPETVSTDCDISSRLFFDPLSYEDVMNLIFKEKPSGVIVQFGGQIPLNLASLLEKAGVNVLGTKPMNINWAEDRELFQRILINLELNYPPNIVVNSVERAIKASELIGFPLMVRPSFILGGRAINIARDLTELVSIINMALTVSYGLPVIVDKFLDDSIEIDVDLLSDGYDSVICGILEHVESAGIHSGDSACLFPSQNIEKSILKDIEKISRIIALKFKIIGFVNIQYAIKGNRIYVIEVNPRASRTIPFISKVRGFSFVKYATKILLGRKISDFNVFNNNFSEHIAVKESVFPFDRFVHEKILLGPSMKSTGEVMGIDLDFRMAYAKAQIAAGQKIPLFGTVLLDSKGKDESLIFLINRFKSFNFKIIMEEKYLSDKKLFFELGVILDDFSSIVRKIKAKKIKLVMSMSKIGFYDEEVGVFGRIALNYRIPYFTTVSACLAVCDSIEALLYNKVIKTKSLQEYNRCF